MGEIEVACGWCSVGAGWTWVVKEWKESPRQKKDNF